MNFGTGYAHMRDRGRAPGWGQTQRWGLAGANPSVNVYDADFGASDSDVNNTIRNGFHVMGQRLPLSAPTMNRSGRVSAQHDSLPAARYFQGYQGMGSGTGRAWSGGSTANVPRSLHQGWNANMQGAAELHPATTYDPFPSPSSLYPKVV